MARIICSWQCCRLLFGNIANGIASKKFFFSFLTELGNFKQIFFGGNAIGNGLNHLLLTMLQTFLLQYCQWHCLQKKICLKLPDSVRNAKIILKAMPLAMLPTKCLQHCQDQMIRAIVYCAQRVFKVI